MSKTPSWCEIKLYIQNCLKLVLTSRTASEDLEAALMDFFQLFWLRPTSLCPRHLQEGNVNCYLQNWLSLVLTSRTASEALEAVLMDFFQLFWLRLTSLCLRHLPEGKENFYLQNWLSLVLTWVVKILKNCTLGLALKFQIFSRVTLENPWIFEQSLIKRDSKIEENPLEASASKFEGFKATLEKTSDV